MEWRKTAVELPEIERPCLVCWHGVVQHRTYSYSKSRDQWHIVGGKSTATRKEFTHWQYMPDPPK